MIKVWGWKFLGLIVFSVIIGASYGLGYYDSYNLDGKFFFLFYIILVGFIGIHYRLKNLEEKLLKKK